MRTNNYIGKLLVTATVLLLSILSSACYREHNPSRFQLKDTLYVADTLTAQQQDLYERRRRLKDTIKTMQDGYRLLAEREPAIRHSLNRNQYYELE